MNLEYWKEHEPILLRFEQLWEEGSSPSITQVLTHTDVPALQTLVVELAMIDIEHRIRTGEIIDIDSYASSLPFLVNAEAKQQLAYHQQELLNRPPHLNATKTTEDRRLAESTILHSDGEMRDGRQDQTFIPPLDQQFAKLCLDGFQIKDKIGSGAFATVYSALDTKLNRKVAVKFLNTSHNAPADRARLRREAQVVATLSHPNLLTVYATGSHAGTDYIVSEYIHGESLQERLADCELSITEAVRTVEVIASAVAVAHRVGVTHRDIKPANIMLTGTKPTLVDFGLATLGEATKELTSKGDLLGTPAYMPPEQASGHGFQADARSDIYSLGAVLFRLCCGKLPFDGTATQVLQQVLHSRPDLPRSLNPLVNRDLQTVILKCLEKDCADRYQSADDLASDLRSILNNEPISARPLGLPARAFRWAQNHQLATAGLVIIATLVVFLGGAASQLKTVLAERNRAQSAEQSKQLLLAKSSADAGVLAMQRGSFEEAVRHFDLSIAQGHRQPEHLLKCKVESLMNLGQFREAEKLLDQSQQLKSLDQYQSYAALTRAEIALASSVETDEVIELFQRTNDSELTSTQRKYLYALLADDSPTATTTLKQITLEDPFHYRARLQLGIMLLLLAETEQANEELGLALQIFPNNNDLMLVKALSLAAMGERENAKSIVDATSLPADQKSRWNQFTAWLHNLIFEQKFDKGMGESDLQLVRSSLQDFTVHYLPLIRNRSWAIPPKIKQQFQNLIKGFQKSEDEPSTQSSKILSKLSSVHPEGSLYLIEAGLLLSELSGSADAIDEVSSLQNAQTAFLSSLESPGFLVQSNQPAWKGVFLTSMMLGMIHKVESEKNRELYLRAAANVNTNSITTDSSARAFTIASLNGKDLPQAERWSSRWSELAEDGDSQFGAMWHLGIVNQRKKDWISVKKLAEQMLKIKPEHKQAKDMLESAITELRNVLDE